MPSVNIVNFVILQIERIQNCILWQTYQLRKKFICKKNKSENNEKLLFHGTAASSLSSINYYGFDRGYAGKNGESLSKSVNFLDMYECYRMSML